MKGRKGAKRSQKRGQAKERKKVTKEAKQGTEKQEKERNQAEKKHRCAAAPKPKYMCTTECVQQGNLESDDSQYDSECFPANKQPESSRPSQNIQPLCITTYTQIHTHAYKQQYVATRFTM